MINPSRQRIPFHTKSGFFTWHICTKGNSIISHVGAGAVPSVFLKGDSLFWLFLEKSRFVEKARKHMELTEVGSTNVRNAGLHVVMVSGRYCGGKLLWVTTVLSKARSWGDWDTETLHLRPLFKQRENLPLGDKRVKRMGRSRMRAIANIQGQFSQPFPNG